MDLTNQIELEQLFNKNQVIPRLKREFNDPVIVQHCATVGIPLEFALDLLVQMELHKRAGIDVLVGLLHKHFRHDENPFQACADMLYKAAEHDLVHWAPDDQRMVIAINVDEETRAELDLYQYPLPMVVEPKPVHSNRDTGMFTSRGSIILKDNHHEEDVCLDHINRVNRTKLAINGKVVRMIRNSWKGLDKRKEGETAAEFAERKRAFEKYDRISRDVIDHVVMMDAPFHLTHRYDKRGRTYAQGYHVNPQGNDWNKAVVELAQKEIVA